MTDSNKNEKKGQKDKVSKLSTASNDGVFPLVILLPLLVVGVIIAASSQASIALTILLASFAVLAAVVAAGCFVSPKVSSFMKSDNGEQQVPEITNIEKTSKIKSQDIGDNAAKILKENQNKEKKTAIEEGRTL